MAQLQSTARNSVAGARGGREAEEYGGEKKERNKVERERREVDRERERTINHITCLTQRARMIPGGSVLSRTPASPKCLTCAMRAKLLDSSDNSNKSFTLVAHVREGNKQQKRSTHVFSWRNRIETPTCAMCSFREDKHMRL